MASKGGIQAAGNGYRVIFERKACRLLRTSAVNHPGPASPLSPKLSSVPANRCDVGAEGWAGSHANRVLAGRMRRHPFDDELDCRTVGSADPPVGEGFERNGMTAVVTGYEHGAIRLCRQRDAGELTGRSLGMSCAIRFGWPHPRSPRWIWCDRRTPSSRPPWPQRPYATFFPCEHVRIPRGARKPLPAILHFVPAPSGCGVDRRRS